MLIFLPSCHNEKFDRIYIAEYPDNKQIAVSFTFDDGCPSVFNKVVPLFDQYGYKATFFILPSVVKEEDWTKWKDLLIRGYEIGNHSMSHRDLTLLDSTQLVVEVVESKHLIESKLGSPVISFAHPHHHLNEGVEELVIRHHAFSRAHPGFCKWYGWTSQTTEEFFLHDIKKAFKNRDWFVPAIHGVGDCWEPIDESLLTAFLNYIREQNDKIVVETFGNVGKYKSEKSNTTLNVKEEANRKVVSLISKLDPVFYNYPLTVVIEDYDFPDEFKINSLSGDAVTFVISGGDLLIRALPTSTFEITW